MRNRLLTVLVGALVIFGVLFSSNTAMAAPATRAVGPNTGAHLAWGGPGGPVLGEAWTNSWKRGTIKLEVVIWRDGDEVFRHPYTCAGSTACAVNPSPIVLPCACPGEYTMYAYSYGPATNGVTFDSDAYTIIVSLLAGKVKITDLGHVNASKALAARH